VKEVSHAGILSTSAHDALMCVLSLSGRLASARALCDRAKVADLTPGMLVEISTNPDVCAYVPPEPEPGKKKQKNYAESEPWLLLLVRVRVTKGEHAGAIGCFASDRLREPVGF
jgi:hypothetical protein